MKVCASCKTDSSKKWRNNICNACYLKGWRRNNKNKVVTYSSLLETRFRKSQRNAKSRKLDWQLSLEEFSEFCLKPCFYCENKIGDIVTQGSGLDRINNDIGYILGNVVSCCHSCNKLRNNILSFEETKEVIKFILNLRKK